MTQVKPFVGIHFSRERVCYHPGFAAAMKLIDVTVPLDASLPTYPGNTPFSIEAVKRIARGDSSNVSTLHMSAHAGTHVDAPRHFFDEAGGADALPLEMMVGRTRVVEITSRSGIGAEQLADLDLSDDVRILFKTSNSRLWASPEFHTDYVGVTASGAEHLIAHGIKVVGVDYLTVEEFKKPGAPAHHVLLGGGAIIIEGLNLRDVDPGIYDMLCLPLRVVGADGAPARVLLRRN
jgi:arylformamidase